jgi:alpha-L-arabinofuranosidase
MNMKKIDVFIMIAAIAALLAVVGFFHDKDQEDGSLKPAENHTDTSTSSPTASTAAEINIDTSREIAIERGFQGLNNPIQKGGMQYLDDDLIQTVNRAELGWIRYGAGTVVGNYNWKLGVPEGDKIAQFGDNDTSFDKFLKYTIAKGGQQLSNYYELTRRTGTKIIVTINPFTDQPESIGDLAEFVKDNHIQVEYWQLGNEPYYWRYIGRLQNGTHFFASATDYLNKVKPFNDAIKAVLPDAKTLVYYAPDPADPTNNEITRYPDRFWNGITLHQYEGDGKDLDTAIKNTNTALSNWENRIDQYIKKSWDDVPIVITEYGVKINGKLEGTHYAGMFVAESALRATKHTNIKYMGGYRLYGGLANPANPGTAQLEAAYEKGETVDTTGWNFALYSSAPAVDLQVIYPAINRSGALWDTGVTGGLEVDTSTSKIPALYAQAYKGEDGNNYVVIVNKSAQEHQVTIKQDGQAVNKTMSKTFVSANPAAKNSKAKPKTISLQKGETTNPVAVPAYSVIRLEWSARQADVLPTRLTHAQVTGKDSVTLKWQPLKGTDTYSIRYGTASGKYTETVQVDRATEQTISGLAVATPYYFVVYPGNHPELPSNELSAEIAIPPAPELTRVYPKQGAAIGVEWRSVEGATGYKVKYGMASGVYSAAVDAGNVSGYVLKGLSNDTVYYITVLAYNGAGESAEAKPFSTTTEQTRVYAPNNLRLVSSRGDQVSLAWVPSPTNGNVTGGTYKVYRSTKPYPLSDYRLLASVDDTSYTDSGLTAGQTYYYTVTSDRVYGSDAAHPDFRRDSGPDDEGPVFGNSNIVPVTIRSSK